MQYLLLILSTVVMTCPANTILWSSASIWTIAWGTAWRLRKPTIGYFLWCTFYVSPSDSRNFSAPRQSVCIRILPISTLVGYSFNPPATFHSDLFSWQDNAVSVVHRITELMLIMSPSTPPQSSTQQHSEEFPEIF